MPEGDTLHRTASRLAPALTGGRVVRLELTRALVTVPLPGAGTRVDGVEARGKHLLVAFADGSVLRTHLRMTGSWHVYAPGERWRKPPGMARVVLEVEHGADGCGGRRVLAVCFSAPDVTLVRARDADARLAGLGPDLCLPDPDLAAVVARARRLDPGTELGVALLDQRIASGIGNVYKSEVCWACRTSPFATLGSLDDERLAALFGTAARLLRANLHTARRTTVDGGLAVYGRRGRACLRCGTPIRSRRQGEQARSTYWCPTCQPLTAA